MLLSVLEIKNAGSKGTISQRMLRVIRIFQPLKLGIEKQK